MACNCAPLAGAGSPPGVAVVPPGLARRSSPAVTSSRIHQASEGRHCPGRVAQGMQGAGGGPTGQARHPKPPVVSGGKGPECPHPAAGLALGRLGGGAVTPAPWRSRDTVRDDRAADPAAAAAVSRLLCPHGLRDVTLSAASGTSPEEARQLRSAGSGEAPLQGERREGLWEAGGAEGRHRWAHGSQSVKSQGAASRASAHFSI